MRPLVALVFFAAFSAPTGAGAQTDAEQARSAPLERASADGRGSDHGNARQRPHSTSSVPTRSPRNRAFLRLVVNVGSIAEEADEQGVAHFLEHMAFNGTENFEKNELVERLEAIGMRLGTGLNARTAFDETVYMLSVPTDVPEHMDTAMQILEDWAGGITLDPEEIELERGVVLEEWRARPGRGIAHSRSALAGVVRRLAVRGAVADRHGREHRSHRSRRFARVSIEKWYRPDLMAVIAVGDFDVARIEQLIRQHFSGLESPSRDAPRRVAHDVPSRARSRVFHCDGSGAPDGHGRARALAAAARQSSNGRRRSPPLRRAAVQRTA